MLIESFAQVLKKVFLVIGVCIFNLLLFLISMFLDNSSTSTYLLLFLLFFLGVCLWGYREVISYFYGVRNESYVLLALAKLSFSDQDIALRYENLYNLEIQGYPVVRVAISSGVWEVMRVGYKEFLQEKWKAKNDDIRRNGHLAPVMVLGLHKIRDLPSWNHLGLVET